MPNKPSYFRECAGELYARTPFGFTEGATPANVREALTNLAGTKEADVIAALAWQHDADRRRYASLLARYLELKAECAAARQPRDIADAA